MSTIITSRSGPDSKLHLEIPVSQPGTDYDVEVVVRSKKQGLILPPSYFNLIGSITDDTFVRPPQGEPPAAAELE